MKVRRVIARTAAVLFVVLLGFLFVNIGGFIYEARPQLEEHSWQGYINWADNLAYYGDYDLAVKAVETAIEKDPQNPEGYVFLAEVYLRNRDIENAKAVYAQAAEKLGENKLFTNGAADISNIDIEIDLSKSEDVSKEKTDSVKYANLNKYNSNGDIVYSFARSHDWERPDIETFYEYNSDNQLLKVTELNSFELPVYITYDYYDNGNVKTENKCEFDGFVYERTHYNENGVKCGSETHMPDRSYIEEFIDENEYVYRKEFYSAENQLEYYSEYEMTESEDYDEITKYYNADGTIKYTVLHNYSSTIKSVEKETYLNADGSVAMIVDHADDKNYYVYTDDKSSYNDGGDYVTSKFYAEIDEYVHQQLGILK